MPNPARCLPSDHCYHDSPHAGVLVCCQCHHTRSDPVDDAPVETPLTRPLQCDCLTCRSQSQSSVNRVPDPLPACIDCGEPSRGADALEVPYCDECALDLDVPGWVRWEERETAEERQAAVEAAAERRRRNDESERRFSWPPVQRVVDRDPSRPRPSEVIRDRIVGRLTESGVQGWGHLDVTVPVPVPPLTTSVIRASLTTRYGTLESTLPVLHAAIVDGRAIDYAAAELANLLHNGLLDAQLDRPSVRRISASVPISASLLAETEADRPNYTWSWVTEALRRSPVAGGEVI